jgi:hypothetical protein
MIVAATTKAAQASVVVVAIEAMLSTGRAGRSKRILQKGALQLIPTYVA